MEELYIRIEAYQKAMGYDFASYTIEERMQAFRNYVTALLVEQGELTAEVPWKPWRSIEDQPSMFPNTVAEEWVDCLFFLYDQALCLGLSMETLRKAFEYKMEKNMARLSNGYNNKP